MKLRDAIHYIRNASNVSFIIGAGASRTAGIPMAPALVLKINEEFGHCLDALNLSKKDRNDYGQVMWALDPSQRRALIQPLLDQSKINWGSIALASLIAHEKIDRVLTFNFDFVVERATALLGKHLPVYDFATAPTRDLSGLASPAIFHLHGQSYGLRLLNAGNETRDHKRSIKPIISDTVRNHLTVVVGYSGEADPAYKIIKKEYNATQTLIWLGFEEEPKQHLKSFLKDNDYAHYIGKCDFDRVMMEIAKGLDMWPSQIFDNPPAHLVKELEDVAQYPKGEHDPFDILSETRDRLKKSAIEWPENDSEGGKAQRDLLAGDETFLSETLDDMSETEKTARAWARVRAGDALADEALTLVGAARAAKFALASEEYKAALQIKPNMHEALNNWGNALGAEALGLEGAARAEKFSRS